MKTTPRDNRWRVTVIRPNGHVGVSYFCKSVAQRACICLTLATNRISFTVESYFVADRAAA